jgi:signal transduction histidine kinase/CheY-like chemotaxis protein/HAMP domain-containing protein
VAGTWKDLTDNVNFMADRLTNQVRGIAKVVTAVANGDLKRKLTVDAKGEIAELADTINGMIDTLATFADQVTTVAREVGVEGKLGGQASVPGASGTWRDLTDNVNQLAANLTTQVRAIADVATAVTKGDLTRSISLEAQGEMAALKDTINEMIRNLRETTIKNNEQDWLKTNLAKFSRMLQGQKDLLTVGRLILSELAPVVNAQQGVFYTLDTAKEEAFLKLLASYAYKQGRNADVKFRLGEGLVGQCAMERDKILLTNIPEDYIKISSGLGGSSPKNVIVIPVVFEGQVKAVLELASFDTFSPTHQQFLDQLTESIGIVLNTIEANTRTEDLLKQSQSLARELQSQQEELQQTNAELGEKARLLADQNQEVERKNHEVEHARRALEEKAEQLALTSKYKSEFLANMSHELRTPLNSLLILSDQLSRNGEGNLTQRQVEFAKTIHSSGDDLLALINDILDLSKIESGTVVVDIGDVTVRDLTDYVYRTFRHVADSKRLGFELRVSEDLPRMVRTDAKRLQQILKNLLSNAFKFTERGHVTLNLKPVHSGWNPGNEMLNRAASVLSLSVSDSGIGIPPEKQQIIFEAFQQADGSTSRKYGGTGLGLAISREIAKLLGGELALQSQVGVGSTFTLYLPQTYTPPRVRRGLAGTNAGSVEAHPIAELPAPEAEESTAKTGQVIVEPETASTSILGDSGQIQDGDRVVLKAIAVQSGTAGLAAAQQYKPVAITLDINLPDIDGWRVLDRLKDDTGTRHIPVQVITTEPDVDRALRMGAMGLLTKPVRTKSILDDVFTSVQKFIEPHKRDLLVVEAAEESRKATVELIDGDDVEIRSASTVSEALAAMTERRPDLLVVNVDVGSDHLFGLIDRVTQASDLAAVPTIVSVNQDLSKKDERHLQRLVRSHPVKDARSPERLLDEVSLFLHRPLASMSPEKRGMIESLHEAKSVLAGKRVLVVDDDIRNIFAMTSVLERYDMRIASAETGRGAIESLQATPDVDVVLMDIMMPDMDGYDTMRAIRKLPKFRSLPIIALTAKAMKGDREKCIQAGASDYIAKPVDTEHLLTLLRVWLFR